MTERGGLGALVERARLRRGWTQRELAEKLGVQQTYVSAIETGARKWPQDYVRPLACLLGLRQVDMAVAAGLIDPPGDGQPAPVYDPVVAELVEAAEGLSPEAVRAFAQAIRYAKEPLRGTDLTHSGADSPQSGYPAIGR